MIIIAQVGQFGKPFHAHTYWVGRHIPTPPQRMCHRRFQGETGSTIYRTGQSGRATEAYTRSFFVKIHHSRPATHRLPTVPRSPTTNQSMVPIVRKPSLALYFPYFPNHWSRYRQRRATLVVGQPTPCRRPNKGVSSVKQAGPDAPGTILCGHFSDEPPLLMPKPDGNDENVHRHRRSKSGVSIHRAGLPGRAYEAYTRSFFEERHQNRGFRASRLFPTHIAYRHKIKGCCRQCGNTLPIPLAHNPIFLRVSIHSPLYGAQQ